MQEVAALYANAVRLSGPSATPAAFQQSAAAADVIHFATHGNVPAGAHGSPSLLLSGDRLDSRAIAATSLPRTSVVVLAACDSARGPERAEGTISVARAFLAAGVPEVLGTLWPIDDAASAQFFPRVHYYLSRGLSLAEATRQAQIESIKRGKPSAFWAAVQCTGS